MQSRDLTDASPEVPMLLEHPERHRVPGREHEPERLAVPVPQLAPQQSPGNRSPENAGESGEKRRIEVDEGVGAVEDVPPSGV
jgi:hypothetical protein